MMSMKRRLACVAGVVAALLLAVSCGNVLEAPKAEGVPSGKGRLAVSMGDGRAVFPETLEFEEDKDLTFTLSGSLSGGASGEIRSWSASETQTAYQMMEADTSLTVEAGQWSFTLQAKRDETVVATATKELEVRGGQVNKLSFGTMAYSGEGTGSVSVTLSWNAGERVTSVVAGLYHRDSGELVENTEVTFSTIEGAQVTYAKSDVPAGTYRLKAQLKQDTAVIGTYRELVRVAGGLESKATRELGSLNTLYTVTLEWGGEGSLKEGRFPETYNRYQTVTLPAADQVASTTGAEFLHWYEKGDADKKEVSQITSLDGDRTYCAYWQVAPVTFTPADGTKFYFDEPLSVTLATATDGATIQYKLGDGSWQDYTVGTPIPVTTSTTITAKATKDGLKDSDETTATYTVRQLTGITVPTPTKTVYSVGDTFDITVMTVTATYDGGAATRDVTESATTDFANVTGEKGIGKTVTVSYKEGEIEKTDEFTVTVFPAEVKVLTDYPRPNHTGSEWTYVEFGDWPQTIKKDNVTVDETKSKTVGMFTYYLGSDGNYYVKQEEKAYEANYTYSDGTTVGQGGSTSKYFKVEPIVWRVLNKDYATTGNTLLLAENILTGDIPYYVDTNQRTIGSQTVYANNYQYSTVRAWLNGKYEGDDTQTQTYTNTGFLQSAFAADAQTLIATTTVDNSAASTNPASNDKQWNSGINPYASDTPTQDKVFLLSEKEATTSSYGFAEYNQYDTDSTRIRVTTDYAKATGAYQSSTEGCGGWWWLRSPNYNFESSARFISDDGNASYDYFDFVDFTRGGVVPALCVELW